MHTLTAIYRTPENKEDFNAHYNQTHTPLVKQMEGIRKIEVTWIDKMLTPANETLPAQPHMICTMYFDNKDALKSAMKSTGGLAAAKDLMGFAGTLVSMVTGETKEVAI